MEQQEALNQSMTLIQAYRNEMAKVIVGQQKMVDGLLAALVAGGHILLEGVPGLAKTQAVKTLAKITGLDFKRIQFTPDLLPADLTGTLIWEQNKGTFSVRKGPVFANVILADEINRAPAKVQSALLEAMEEKQVTIGENSYPLPQPFFVLATENPIEHEGTYSLPEAELDRFLLKLMITYPKPEEELEIVKRASPLPAAASDIQLSTALDEGALGLLRAAADSVHVDRRIAEYIVSIVTATRPLSTRSALSTDAPKPQAAGDSLYPQRGRGPKFPEYRSVSFGASPRASIALHRCSKIFAMFEGRNFVSPDDVKTAAFPVLRHRLVLSYEAEAEGLDADAVISRILSHVPVP